MSEILKDCIGIMMVALAALAAAQGTARTAAGPEGGEK